MGLCLCSICCQRNPLWWWVDEAGISDYSKISSGILFIVCFALLCFVYLFSPHLWFYPRTQSYLVSVSLQSSRVRHVLPLEVWVSLNQTWIGHTYKFCVIITIFVVRTDCDKWILNIDTQCYTCVDAPQPPQKKQFINNEVIEQPREMGLRTLAALKRLGFCYQQ